MPLIEKYLPDHQFSERHSVEIPAPPARVMAAVLDHRPEDDWLFRCANAVRELPMRACWRLRDGAPPPPFGMHRFTLLEQAGDEELVFGLAGQFWRFDYGPSPVADGPAFLAFHAPGSAKLVLGFTARKSGNTHTRLTTETRVLCTDPAALRRFAPYWYLIRPVSGLIRRRMLASIRRNAAPSAPSEGG